MPKIQISICPRCKGKTCDGSVWKMISAIPTIGKNANKEDIENIPAENRINCGNEAFGGGGAIKKMPTPRGPVGITTAKRFYPNWVVSAT